MGKKHDDYVSASRGHGKATDRHRNLSDEAFGKAVQKLIDKGKDPIAASLIVQRESGELG